MIVQVLLIQLIFLLLVLWKKMLPVLRLTPTTSRLSQMPLLLPLRVIMLLLFNNILLVIVPFHLTLVKLQRKLLRALIVNVIPIQVDLSHIRLFKVMEQVLFLFILQMIVLVILMPQSTPIPKLEILNAILSRVCITNILPH